MFIRPVLRCCDITCCAQETSRHFFDPHTLTFNEIRRVFLWFTVTLKKQTAWKQSFCTVKRSLAQSHPRVCQDLNPPAWKEQSKNKLGSDHMSYGHGIIQNNFLYDSNTAVVPSASTNNHSGRHHPDRLCLTQIQTRQCTLWWQRTNCHQQSQ